MKDNKNINFTEVYPHISKEGRTIAELTRKLNIGHMLAIIVGTVIGSGIFITLPIVARETGSPILAIE